MHQMQQTPIAGNEGSHIAASIPFPIAIQLPHHVSYLHTNINLWWIIFTKEKQKQSLRIIELCENFKLKIVSRSFCFLDWFQNL